MELASARAVISGGASGLGLATAQRVIDAGGQVVLLDIDDEQGAASAADLGDRAAFINTDVSSEESVKAALSAANETMGGITLVVNCAGIPRERGAPAFVAVHRANETSFFKTSPLAEVRKSHPEFGFMHRCAPTSIGRSAGLAMNTICMSIGTDH